MFQFISFLLLPMMSNSPSVRVPQPFAVVALAMLSVPGKWQQKIEAISG